MAHVVSCVGVSEPLRTLESVALTQYALVMTRRHRR